MDITLEFGGGAELLFNSQKKHHVTLPEKRTNWRMSELLEWVKDNLLKETKSDLFIQEGSVRPGILVLINDIDWELMDTVDYILRPHDKILFISTLHGG